MFESVRTLHGGSGAEIQKTLGPPASENTAVNSCCGTSQMAWPQHFKWQLLSYLTSAILKMRSYGPSLYLTQTKKVCASHSPVRGSLCQEMQHYLRARPFREGELVDAFITALYALGNHCGYSDLITSDCHIHWFPLTMSSHEMDARTFLYSCTVCPQYSNCRYLAHLVSIIGTC